MAEGTFVGPSLVLEPLTEKNLPVVLAIRREDVSEDFVDSAASLWELTQYGAEHGCLDRKSVV